MRELYAHTATELAILLSRGEVSSRQLVVAHLERIAAVEGKVHALTMLYRDGALAAAEVSDRERRAGQVRSALHGLPITIKECFDVAGEATTLGMRSRREHRAARDAALLTALREAGAIVLGRTNISQTMLFNETRNPLFGETHNPHRLDRSPGGSSGGEAAAVASGMSPLGVGSDIGGSIRVPAHFCGVVGVKPTLDRLPANGITGGIPGQEAVRGCPGPLARSVADLELFFSALDGARLSELDPRVPPLPWKSVAPEALRGVRVGYYEHDGFVPASAALRRAVGEARAALVDAGCVLEPFAPPRTAEAIFMQIEALSADGARTLRDALDGDEVDRAIKPLMFAAMLPDAVRTGLAGVFDLRGDDTKARLLRSLGEKRVAGFFQLVARLRDYRNELVWAMRDARLDLLLCPPYATPAFAHGGSVGFALAGSYAMLFNLAQLPAGVVPVTRVRPGELGRPSSRRELERLCATVDEGASGLPVGVQLVAHAWQEPLLLAAMGAVEVRVRGTEGFPQTPVEPSP